LIYYDITANLVDFLFKYLENPKSWSGGSTSRNPPDLKFMFLETSCIEYTNNWIRGFLIQIWKYVHYAIPPFLWYIWVASISSGYQWYEDLGSIIVPSNYLNLSAHNMGIVSKNKQMPPVGSLHLCLEMPDSMQKESFWSDTLVQRNVQNILKYWTIWHLSKPAKLEHIFDVFSGLGIDSWSLRHKFRLPTRGILEKNYDYLCLTPFVET
jgi:hypothetical protein